MDGLGHAWSVLSCPLEAYAGPCILTVGILCFILVLACMLEYSSECTGLPFVTHEIFIVIWILEFYCLD
jgi:hypothetical protein